MRNWMIPGLGGRRDYLFFQLKWSVHVVHQNKVQITTLDKKKKNHRGDASCDIEESAVWFHCDASMREVAAVASRVRLQFRS